MTLTEFRKQTKFELVNEVLLLRAENERLREALSWLEDHEPQLVDAAKEKFGIK